MAERRGARTEDLQTGGGAVAPSGRRPLRRWGAVWLAALGACGGGDASLELRLGHATPPQSLIALSADEFARRANERLAGTARVIVYGSGQLGDDAAVLQKLQLGTVDLAVPSSVLSSAVEEFALFELPYLVADRDHMQRIAEDIVWPDLAPRLAAEGLELLGVWENGFRHITNNVRPVVTPDDLRGIKIRTPRSRWRVDMFRAFGANPSPMAFSEVFVALQTGVMDGQENPLTNIANASLFEVQEYLSLTGHVYSPAYLVAGMVSWNRLPEHVRRVLAEEARATSLFVRQTAEEIDRRTLARLEEAGMQVNDVDRGRFVTASRPVYDAFGASVAGGDTLVARALALRSPR